MFDFGIEFVLVSYSDKGRFIGVNFRDGSYLATHSHEGDAVEFMAGWHSDGALQDYPLA